MKLEELVNNNYMILNQNDLHIWKYICTHMEECCTISIDKLAKKCNISRATISRFSQKLSLTGFGEFKTRLKLELEDKDNIDDSTLNDICQHYKKAIQGFEQKDMSDICKLIYHAEQLFVCATGYIQNIAAKVLKRNFMNMNKFFITLYGNSETEVVVDTATSQDLIIIISLSGENTEAVELAKKVKSRNVPVVSISQLTDNSLSKVCDYNLYITSDTIKMSEDKSYQTTAQYFMLIELLFIKYVMYCRRV